MRTVVKRLKHLPVWLVQAFIFATSVMVIGGIHSFGGFERLNHMAFDSRLKAHRADKVLPDDIAVILIDEHSIKALEPSLGRFPWPRAIYAELAEYLLDMGGARAVMFDILFTETEQGTRQALSDHDMALVSAGLTYDSIYHAGLMFKDEPGAPTRPLPDIMPGRHAIGKASGLNGGINNAFVLPFEALLHTAPHLGIVSLEADSDGIYRRARPLFEYDSRYYPAFGLAALLDRAQSIQAVQDNRLLSVGELSMPVDSAGNLLLNYYSDYRPYSMYGVLDSLIKIRKGNIAEARVFPDEFENRIVLVGASAVGLEDIKATSINHQTPGVFIHATVAANLLTNDHLAPANPVLTYLALVLIALLTVIAISRLDRTSLQFLVPLALGLGYVTLADWQLAHNRVLGTVTPLVGLTTTWLGSLSYRTFIESKGRRRIKKMLSQYVSPSVMADVMNNPDDILHAQVGLSEVMSVLFSDVRCFTSHSEHLSAQDTVRLLNCHFGEMTEAIFEHDGTLDKFIGDALMAFWGAPLRTDKHADQAVAAALTMLDKLETVNLRLADQGLPVIDIGIGINTGEVILGNIGSDRKLDYTVIGDNVNLASRVEGLTKMYGVRLLIAESTYQALTLNLPCVHVDRVQVKGRSLPVDIYAPWTGSHPDEAELDAAREVADAMAAALSLYYRQNFTEAAQAFEKLPHPGLRELYLNRCRAFQQNPPGKDWRGVYTAESK